MQTAQDTLVNRTLGPYALQGTLDWGGMGVVLRATYSKLDQPRAVRVLPPQMALDADLVARFRRETKIAARLRHPHIVHILDVGEADGCHFIAMELVEGVSLRQLLVDSGPFPAARALGLLGQIADALDYAHLQGVLHRALKPANVLVGPHDHLTLLEFGIARVSESERRTRSGTRFGRPEYTAPEVMAGDDGGPGADRYALGIIAFELLTGRRPVDGPRSSASSEGPALTSTAASSSKWPELPEPVSVVLARQLAEEPERRFPSAASFVAALCDAVDRASWSVRPGDESSPVPPGRLAEQALSRDVPATRGPERRATDRRRLAAGLAFGLVLLAGIIVGNRWLVSGAGPLAGPPERSAGAWIATASLSTARCCHAATALAEGRVLVSGGYGSDGATLAAVELYDPSRGTWTATANLVTARAGHTATLLPNGKVLVAGGLDSSDDRLSSAELYDPERGTWGTTGSLLSALEGHTATPLPDGKVLVAGGTESLDAALALAQIYDPPSGRWTATGSMAMPRAFHRGTRLGDGRVLVTGGSSEAQPALAAAEVYDPAAGVWSPAGVMAAARIGHSATLLPDDRVLVAGGRASPAAPSPLASAELYDPVRGTWAPTGSLRTARFGHSAALIAGGKVLVALGSNYTQETGSAERYDPATGTWSSAGVLTPARYAQAMTLLPDGRALLSGGQNGGTRLATVELYRASE